MAGRPRIESASGAEDRCGGCDRGTAGERGVEVHLEEHGGTTARPWPK